MTTAPAWIRIAIGSRRQRDVAREMGISEQYLSDMLYGRRLISARAALAFERVLRLDAAMLLYIQNLRLLEDARNQEQWAKGEGRVNE